MKNLGVAEKNYAKAILEALLFAYLLCVPVMFTVTSYAGTLPDEALSFFRLDGICNSAVEGFSGHCWGDYFLSYRVLLTPNPWDWHGAFPYPPAGLFIWLPFSWLGQMLGTNAGLIGFLFLGLTAQVIPILDAHFVENRISVRGALQALGMSLASIGYLAVFDRGNSTVFAIPLLYYFAKNAESGRYGKSFVWGLLLVAIKPQFILIGLLFIPKVGLRTFIKWGFGSVLAVFGPFLFYGSSALHNAVSFVKNVLKYFGYGEFGAPYPINLSIKNTLEIVSAIIGFRTYPIAYSLISGALGALMLTLLLMVARRLSWNSSLFLMVIFIFVFSGTTFDYYLCTLTFFLVDLVSLAESPSSSNRVHTSLVHTKISAIAAGMLLLLCMVPFVIPMDLLLPEVIHSPVSASLLLGKTVMPVVLGVIIIDKYCHGRRLSLTNTKLA